MDNNTFIVKSENLTKLFYPSLSYSDIAKLRFKHRTPIIALTNISFSIKKGEVLGILGPNGAGKTTLLKILATLVIPDGGKVTIKGNVLGKDNNKIKSLIGYAGSEERSFYWRLTGRHNLEFFASMYGLNKKQTKLRLDYLFRTFKIDYQNIRFSSYSTGMKRIFALIRALLHDPQILLLDELTKSLDYNYLCAIKDYLKSLLSLEKTIIFSTHNITEAQNLCDKFIILNRGRNYGYGTIEELRKKINLPKTSLSEIYLKLTQNV